ncbi:MAG: tRNA (N(6)-L-threonylcarbamoyladenosine(37)-C(2))-methylthiotransferase MtaB [Bacilli bacterium]|nr:tRNA (N(6)-L-threonylcarbamoyladenosine(37)-C(2))-methylthiotransferase MtaB [Bacilli bacterium]
MKIAFSTLGCKVNTYETESVWELFKMNGYQRVPFSAYADVYIINTCTVTNSGDAKSRKTIRKAVKRNPEAVVCVMGCYSQLAAEEVSSIDGVDIVIGTKHREQLLDLVKEVLRERTKINQVSDISRYRVFDEVHVTSFTENTRAFLKIQDGCNNFCTYCIIPFARGPVRSRSKESIIEEATTLVQNGYQEIVLTGIHTGGYGLDLKEYSFVDLLHDLKCIPNLHRLRISSIEVNELTNEILQMIRDNDVFAKHLHIPLQSGSEHVLSAMHRKYDKIFFLEKLRYIRELMPDIAITTDIIVGFPGETEEMFNEMVDFIKTCKFSELHVFPYSKRNGTKAAAMPNQINGIVKSFRVNELLELNEKMANDYIAFSQKKQISVLYETSDDSYTYGHSDTYIYMKVPKDESLHNKIVASKIIRAKYKDTLGEIIN